jgi:hypothetical protein
VRSNPPNSQSAASRALHAISDGLLLISAIALMILAAILIGYAGWAVVQPLWTGEDLTHAVVEAVSYIIIAFAVIALSKFIVEEEIQRQRELASAREARRSLTKMVTIVVIALNLEALVMVFEANRGDVATVVYPTALLAVAVLALVGLGVYQWLSNVVEQDNVEEPHEEKRRGKS